MFCLIYKNLGCQGVISPAKMPGSEREQSKQSKSFIRGKKLPSILCKMSVFKGRDEYIFVLICRATS
jgi:hypothetical protein